MLKRNEVIRVQEIATNCWPAEEYFFLNGWILRFTDGATSRANSVLPLKYIGNNLEEDINLVEIAYRSHDLTVKFMLHDYYAPAELHSKLVDLGYQADPIVDIFGIDLENFAKITKSKDFQYLSYSHRTKKWSEALFKLATNRSKEDLIGMLGIMDRIAIPKKMYFAAIIEKQIIGLVLGVLERNYLGIMDLIVDLNYRRQGVASSLLSLAVEWAEQHSGKHVFLQVVRDNHGAVSLYRKLNFKRWYSYFYMIKD